MKNTCPIYFQVLEVLLIKGYKIQPPISFIYYCFALVFTLEGIIVHIFLELHSLHYLIKDFCHKVAFFNRFTQPPPPVPYHPPQPHNSFELQPFSK